MSNLWIPFGSDILKRCRINKWKANEEDILETKELIEIADTKFKHRQLYSKDRIHCFFWIILLKRSSKNYIDKILASDWG